MELTKKQRILYDLFVKYGKDVGTINYPLTLLNHWINYETHNNLYPEQKAVLEAYLSMENLDKPLYMAIRAIEGWGCSDHKPFEIWKNGKKVTDQYTIVED